MRAKQSDPNFTVVNAVGGVGEAIWLNPTSGLFADQQLRAAMLPALDRASIVETAWHGLAEVQAGMWPDLSFPVELAPFPGALDTAPLKALVAKLPNKKVDLAWAADGGAPRQQMAELVQTQLAALRARGHGARPADGRAVRSGQPAAGQATRHHGGLPRGRRPAPGHDVPHPAAHRREAFELLPVLQPRAGQARWTRPSSSRRPRR